MIETLLARRLRVAVMAGICGLIVLLVLWRAMTGLSAADIVLIAALTLPFAMGLPRLRAGNRRAYAWMTLAVTPYLVLAITEAVANPTSRGWAALCLVIAFAVFVLLIGYLRVTRDRA